MTEEEIVTSLQSLNRNPNDDWDYRTQNAAPHKPFLLLSILDGIKIGWIQGPGITLSQDLIETFFTYWKQIMGESRTTTIALPFFHMKSEPFWELNYKEGAKPYKSSPSLGGLSKRIVDARIDDQLFRLMKSTEGQKNISSTILQHYFSEEIHDQMERIHQINVGSYRYAEQLELLAAEPFQKYHTEEDDQESYTWQKTRQRQQGFGIKVRNNYTHQCAICRTRVQTPTGESLVEGAHIIPWSESNNDDPRNGLALCKTHHWMFDAYLLTVQPDYQIKLSTWLKQEGKQINDTLAWEREQILLPKEERFLPNREALDDHFEKFASVR